MLKLSHKLALLCLVSIFAACAQPEVNNNYLLNEWNLSVEGYSQAYFDEYREAYAVNTVTQPTDQWGAAEAVFGGEDGVYSMVFTSRLETDGEPTYKVLVNNREVLLFTNPRTFNLGIPEHEPYTLIVKNIPMQKNDLVRVEFLPHSNGLVPEDDAFGYARARWKNIVFQKEN
jgi:hypothetical protein